MTHATLLLNKIVHTKVVYRRIKEFFQTFFYDDHENYRMNDVMPDEFQYTIH